MVQEASEKGGKGNEGRKKGLRGMQVNEHQEIQRRLAKQKRLGINKKEESFRFQNRRESDGGCGMGGCRHCVY